MAHGQTPTAWIRVNVCFIEAKVSQSVSLQHRISHPYSHTRAMLLAKVGVQKVMYYNDRTSSCFQNKLKYSSSLAQCSNSYIQVSTLPFHSLRSCMLTRGIWQFFHQQQHYHYCVNAGDLSSHYNIWGLEENRLWCAHGNTQVKGLEILNAK